MASEKGNLGFLTFLRRAVWSMRIQGKRIAASLRFRLKRFQPDEPDTPVLNGQVPPAGRF